MKKYPFTLNLLLTAFLYGVHLVFGYTFIRILEPPMRSLLEIGMLLIPLLGFVGIRLGKKDLTRWAVILITSLWFMIATLYVIHPIPNGGWVLSGSMTLYSLIILWKGDWRE